MSRRAAGAVGAAAACGWVALCTRWFDVGLSRPAWLAAVPPLAPALLTAVLAAAWLRARLPALQAARPEAVPAAPAFRPLLLLVALAILFRLPLAWQGAAAYVTADGALSGIVALHAREGVERLVFVPHVPYSGSLKSHLTVPLSLVMDTARAFALASLAFYALFVAAVIGLARERRDAAGWTSWAAGLYVAFAPAFVTRYSLSNDGNYVEVMALGTLAAWLAVRWAKERVPRGLGALVIGLLLGLAFWCHIRAVIPMAAVGLFLLAVDPRAALRAAGPALFGFALGAAPSLLWNAANGWASFEYLLPGGTPVGEAAAGAGPVAHVRGLVFDHLPVLLGYDPGYPPAIDAVLKAVAFAAVALAVVGFGAAGWAAARQRCRALAMVLVLAAVNLLVALVALPYLPGNPRYLLPLVAPVAIVLAHLLRGRAARPVFTALVAAGALSSWAQAPGAFATDARWRGFVAGLEGEGVRHCYTDFYLATKINFLSEERVLCSSKLGPTTTEYFFAYREQVDRAPRADYVAVNDDNADKLQRRLVRLGVTFDRRDLMKPVLLRLSRKVDPRELFPDRQFPLR
jgi:hypothetical protein